MLWLWCRLATAAPIRPLAWEFPTPKKQLDGKETVATSPVRDEKLRLLLATELVGGRTRHGLLFSLNIEHDFVHVIILLNLFYFISLHFILFYFLSF